MKSNAGPTAPVSPSPTAHPIREGALDLGLTDRPGADQIQAWKSAIAASHRQRRNRRGKRATGIEAIRTAGMVRILPAESERPAEAVSDLPREGSAR